MFNLAKFLKYRGVRHKLQAHQIQLLKKITLNQSKGRNHSAKRKTEKKCKQRRMIVITAILIVVLSLAVFLIVKSCNKADEIKGTGDFDGVTVYQFDGKGNGLLNLPSNRYEFKYEINENEVSIDFKNDNANDVAYTFSLEKDKLILIYNEDKATATYEMKRVE